jgi:hypothetical protein
MKKRHKLTRHHRKPTSIGGTSEKRNLSHIPRGQHEAWHLIFSNHTAETICAIINEKYLDPDYKFVCVKRRVPKPKPLKKKRVRKEESKI